MYRAAVKNLTNNEKKVLPWSYPLRNVLVTTRVTSNTPNTEIALSYQNIYGKNTSPITEWSIVTKVLSKTQ